MKVAYDQMFINSVKKTLPKKYHFLLCLGFYEYLCGVYNIDDIVEKTQSFLREKKIPINEMALSSGRFGVYKKNVR